MGCYEVCHNSISQDNPPSFIPIDISIHVELDVCHLLHAGNRRDGWPNCFPIWFAYTAIPDSSALRAAID